MIRELSNGREVDYNGSKIKFEWASKSKCEVWVAAYGPKALQLTGEVGDGFILQLADIDIAAWTIDAVRKAARDAGRDPKSVKICVAAPAYVGDDIAHMREQCRCRRLYTSDDADGDIGLSRRVISNVEKKQIEYMTTR